MIFKIHYAQLQQKAGHILFKKSADTFQNDAVFMMRRLGNYDYAGHLNWFYLALKQAYTRRNDLPNISFAYLRLVLDKYGLKDPTLEKGK